MSNKVNFLHIIQREFGLADETGPGSEGDVFVDAFLAK